MFTVSTRPVFSRSLRRACPCRYYNVNAVNRPPLAFAFDIDGVLIRGETPIPAARRALDILNGNNDFGLKIPFILLTNGGGISEAERCKKLTEQLGVQIDVEQYIQAHTILKELVTRYEDRPVLVLGGKNDQVRKVAEEYGFKQAYTTLDVMKWDSSVWPLHSLSEEERGSARSADFSKIPIQAAFVFHDPRNWALDVQILLDVVQSGGIIGGPYLHEKEASSRPPVDLVFCNPDLVWRADFDRPRLGQGAFRDAFQAVYKALRGCQYPYVQFGKPTEATYNFAKRVLLQRLASMYGPSQKPINVYMVGDNPESDIAGANAAKWQSILVHTGVYDPQEGPPTHTPTQQTVDVEEAVRWAIRREVTRK